MADKQLNRTVEQINPLLDKIDELPDYMRYKGEVNDPSELPQEPTEGDTYLVNYNSASSTNISDSLYCRLGNSWKIIATKSYTKAVIDAKLETQKAALIELVDGGAKNLLQNTAATQTINGITFTVNQDGTITVDGELTGGSAVLNVATVSTGSEFNGAVLSGCPSGGGDSTYRLYFQLNSGSYTTYASDTGNGAEIANAPDSSCRIRIAVYQSVSNLIFKPMICTKAQWDISQQYVQYRPSYQELYEMVLALQGGNSLQSLTTPVETTEIPEERSDI